MRSHNTKEIAMKIYARANKHDFRTKYDCRLLTQFECSAQVDNESEVIDAAAKLTREVFEYARKNKHAFDSIRFDIVQ